MGKIKKCPDCKKYTLKKLCPECGRQTSKISDRKSKEK